MFFEILFYFHFVIACIYSDFEAGLGRAGQNKEPKVRWLKGNIGKAILNQWRLGVSGMRLLQR
ncbi:hypothetical protein [Pseudophaeobacter leonis]|uniref:hypothetical protein n=1 Tax=Pseudophaeobacter leonis TaxID=1144477 RepID=UPI0009F5B085|nr:hypothetical protein [Pseudophaeobacter leonis]